MPQAVYGVAPDPLDSPCHLSVIMTCSRFLQRLRVSLRNWCHQSLAPGSFEILVVNPESPDGTHEYLATVARVYPHIRLREVPVEADLATNKGAMINRAVQASQGTWIWLTDADCLYGPSSAAAVLKQIRQRPQHLFYGQRRHLPTSHTDAVLTGRIDGLHQFELLASRDFTRPPDNAPWGYTQIVHRSVWEHVRYYEGFSHFAHTDEIFVDECRQWGVTPEQIKGLFCLHLDHPFAWYGTNGFL
jgi:hypothetical protein